jgi:ribosomal protein S18 acetylase RimI-like enzyme
VSPPPVRALREDDIDAAAALLGRSFFGDPLLSYALPDPEVRLRLAARHFAPVVRQAYQCGEVSVAGDMLGVACWRSPGRHDPTSEELARSGLDQMADLIGSAAEARLSQVFEFLDARRHARAVPANHWYLAVIGVDEAAKGGGAGTALVQSKLDQADATGLPVFLETVEHRNVPFYERLGFRCVETATEPVSRLQYWLFLREPTSSAPRPPPSDPPR